MQVLELLGTQVETGIMLEKIVAAKHAISQQRDSSDGKGQIAFGKTATAHKTDAADGKEQQRGECNVLPDFAALSGFTEVDFTYLPSLKDIAIISYHLKIAYHLKIGYLMASH